VIYFLSGPLSAMREPRNDMIGVVGEDLMHVIEPRAGFGRVT
jgi:hypothetical protein